MLERTTDDFPARIAARDLSLFDAIPSESSAHDRESFLLLQATVRESGLFAYLEIGSHLGGSVQPYYVDPLCTRIYTIDPRPTVQPDERGRAYLYVDNSSARMLANLAGAFPSIDASKVRVFDCDARDINPSDIAEKPRLCFIDGEHTNTAVVSDFDFCLKVCRPDGVIAFHDSGIVFRGIQRIKARLAADGVRFQGMMLVGCVYAILVGDAIEEFRDKLLPFAQNETRYFLRSKVVLSKSRLFNRWPRVGQFAGHSKRTVLGLMKPFRK